MGGSFKALIIGGFLLLIVWHLGAGLYYMLADKGSGKRTVNALTWRIGLSILLVVLLLLGIHMGWISPHGAGQPPSG